ncbi:hypothetical protein [Nocardia sp. NPDC049707]|uniref:hypothetical protein n=1 Tax=Nocardia sp. NPDC049707 TaxID=3154735 RepID=UPI00344462A5
MVETEISVDFSINIDIPQGFMELPLGTINESIAQADSLFGSLGAGTMTSAAPAVLQALRVLLSRLAQVNTVYCALGRHVSAGGQQISSTLTISLTEYGEQRNPRLTLGDVLTGRRAAGEKFKNVEFVELPARPILLVDRVKLAPTPELPAYDTSKAQQEVYQLEAVIPSPDGSAIAVIDLSTPFVDSGEEYLSMVAAMAASIEFRILPRRSIGPSSLDL